MNFARFCACSLCFLGAIAGRIRGNSMHAMKLFNCTTFKAGSDRAQLAACGRQLAVLHVHYGGLKLAVDYLLLSHSQSNLQ